MKKVQFYYIEEFKDILTKSFNKDFNMYDIIYSISRYRGQIFILVTIPQIDNLLTINTNANQIDILYKIKELIKNKTFPKCFIVSLISICKNSVY